RDDPRRRLDVALGPSPVASMDADDGAAPRATSSRRCGARRTTGSLGRAGRCSAFLATASANRTWHRLMGAPVAGGVLAYRTLRLVAASAPGCPRAVRRWRSIHWTSSTTMAPSPCLECENRDGHYTRAGV